MPKATIIFKVPQDFAQLQGPIADFPGECDHINYKDLDNLDSQLFNLIGETIQIDFDEPHDPSEPIDRIVKALKGTDAPYLASHESYTEPSRRDRYRARVLARTSEFDVEKQYAWEDGEPDLTKASTFRKAGFDERQIVAIDQTFFPTAAPTPRPAG
jgi:hypothetical protein